MSIRSYLLLVLSYSRHILTHTGKRTNNSLQMVTPHVLLTVTTLVRWPYEETPQDVVKKASWENPSSTYKNDLHVSKKEKTTTNLSLPSVFFKKASSSALFFSLSQQQRVIQRRPVNNSIRDARNRRLDLTSLISTFRSCPKKKKNQKPQSGSNLHLSLTEHQVY